MAPGLTTELPLQQQIPDDDGGVQFKQQSYPKPLKLSGVLEGFAYEDVTPLIGREFPKVNIVDDLLNASNADELLRDVAITSGFFAPCSSLPASLFFFFSFFEIMENKKAKGRKGGNELKTNLLVTN